MSETRWRTSSYSQPNNACVELSWRISIYSQPNNNRVELAHTTDMVVVRDSKNPTGPTLTFAPDRFLAAIKAR
jgi:hypothetical protein